MIFSSLPDILNSGRVILVSSILLKNAQDLDLELLRRRPSDSNTNNPSVQRSNSNVIKEDPKKNYCQSKLMNALYARQVGSRYFIHNSIKKMKILPYSLHFSAAGQKVSVSTNILCQSWMVQNPGKCCLVCQM